MSDDPVCVRSSIRPALKRQRLFRGSLLAIVGAVSIIAAGAFLPVTRLQYWGLPIFLGGAGLIALGLIPYRRLCRLEMNPHKLIITEDKYLCYVVGGNVQMRVPLTTVKALSFQDDGHPYGIVAQLDSGQQFFPYFTRPSLEELQSGLQDIVHFD